VNQNPRTSGNSGTVKSVEDLIVWKRARELTTLIYRVTGRNHLKSDFNLVRQMRRAAVSIVSNIAEGFERNGNREFLQALSIAKGSCGELKTQLHVASDLRYIDQEECRQLC
jgi:four helix bundle protein